MIICKEDAWEERRFSSNGFVQAACERFTLLQHEKKEISLDVEKLKSEDLEVS